ncbi:MAG TPA: acetolactate decarboxylase [Acidimicrobiia bacterium]
MARDIVDDRLIGALHVRALTRAGLAHDHATEHTVFQSGTLDALMAGRYDGDVTIGELLAHGDLGIGTVQHLGGELVVLDGEAWVVDADGAVRPVPAETRTPFAVVCRFTPVATTALAGPLDLGAVHAALDALAPPDEPVVAVRLTGQFSNLRLRSVRAQTPPNPPLTEVTEHQTEWQVGAATGTLLGFRFPAATAGVEVPGYHLHFLSDDRACGGHVLGLGLVAGTAAVDDAGDLHVELPAGVHLGRPGAGADLDAIRRVEGRRVEGGA